MDIGLCSEWCGGKGKFVCLYSVDKVCVFGVLDMVYFFRICQVKNVFVVLKNVREMVVFFFSYWYYFDGV